MDDDMIADEQAYSSGGEDIGRDHIPMVNLRQSWWKTSSLHRISELTQKDLEGLPYELVKVFRYPARNSFSTVPNGKNANKTSHPSSGNDAHPLVIYVYGRKIGRPDLSISKMKVTYYPNAGLKQMVPDQIWIEEESKYDIAAMYGISHWWFQRQRFYIDRHTSEGDRRAVRTHMRILSVVRIKVFSLYGYDYMKKIVLRRADLKEYVIAERDFKYLYPSDFEDLYL
ncbi:hypothetical protein Tco_0335530, partial [Tanacetum coccineum]